MNLTLCTEDNFATTIFNKYHYMHMGDNRPFKTVLNYLSFNHLRMAEDTDSGEWFLVKTNVPSGGRPQETTFPGILKMCAKWSYAAQCHADSSYAQQAAEEDEEEIQLLKEQWDLHNPKKTFYHAEKKAYPVFVEPPVQISKEDGFSDWPSDDFGDGPDPAPYVLY